MIYETYSVGGELYHARSHKYINKFRGKNGKWRYVYKLAKSALTSGRRFMDLDEKMTDTAYNYLANKNLHKYYKDTLDMQKSWTNALQNHRNMNVMINGSKYKNMYKDPISDSKKEEENIRGKMRSTRNEAKLNLRENDRARRDAATNAGVDDYRLATKALIDSGEKIVNAVLKRANKSRQKAIKKR